MNNHDSATIVITFLLLLPWLGRTAVSAMAVWRARTESQTKKAKSIAHGRIALLIASAPPYDTQPTGFAEVINNGDHEARQLEQ